MENSYSHIILYSKNWYKINDKIEDLKILYSNRSLIKPEYVDSEAIVTVLQDIVLELVDFKTFIYEYNQRLFSLVYNKKDSIETMIDVCLSIISHTTTDKITKAFGPCNKPDYNILPEPDK